MEGTLTNQILPTPNGAWIHYLNGLILVGCKNCVWLAVCSMYNERLAVHMFSDGWLLSNVVFQEKAKVKFKVRACFILPGDFKPKVHSLTLYLRINGFT